MCLVSMSPDHSYLWPGQLKYHDGIAPVRRKKCIYSMTATVCQAAIRQLLVAWSPSTTIS